MSRRPVLLVLVLGCAGALVAGAVVGYFHPSNAWAVAAVAAGAIAAAIIGPIFDRLRRSAEAAVHLRDLCQFAQRHLPKVHDVTATQLGVSEIAVRSASTSNTRQSRVSPLYVPRTVDGDIDAAFEHHSFVIIEGDAKAGKSRSGYQALQRLFADRNLVVPRSREALKRLREAKVKLGPCVVWLDGLEKYIGPGGITRRDIEWLTKELPGPVSILATLRIQNRPKPSTITGVGISDDDVVGCALAIPLRRHLDPAEIEEGTAIAKQDTLIADALAHRKYGLAEWLSACPALLERLHDGELGESPAGSAIVRACIDWFRAGLRQPIPLEKLARLAPAYAAPDLDLSSVESNDFKGGLNWATERIFTTASLLKETKDGCEPFDYLVQAIEVSKQPVLSTTWEILCEPGLLPIVDISTVGFSALIAGNETVAERALSVAALAKEPHACNNLGFLYWQQGRMQDASTLLKAGALLGQPESMWALGVMARQVHQLENAKEWFKKALQAGLPDQRKARYHLGLTLWELNDKEGARTVWYEDATAGGADSAFELAVAATASGDHKEAEHWWIQSARLGNATAAFNAGALAAKAGDIGAAIDWWRQAAAGGNKDAAQNLSYLEAGTGSAGGTAAPGA